MISVPIALALAWGLVSSGIVSDLLGLNLPQSVSFMILVLAALFWVTEWIPLYLTSFMILLLQLVWLVPAIDPAAPKGARAPYLAPFFSEIILLFLGGFVLASLLHKFGLDRRLANGLLKWTGTSPAKAMLGFMMASALLSMWMSNTATAAMMFAILLPVAQKIPEGNPFAKGLAVSIPFACNLGGLGTPIGTPPNAIALNFMATKGVHISFLGWMAATIPFMLFFIFILWFFLLKIFPHGGYQLELPEASEGGLSGVQKLVLGIFGLTVTCWFASDLLDLSIGTLSLIPVILAFGFGLLKGPDFKALPWDVLFMVGGGICLGVGLDKSGLTAKIVTLIPEDQTFWIILVAFGIVAALMTTFMSNTATANLLVPLAVSLNQEVGLLAIMIAMNCSTAMALPISTPPNAIAFGSGLLETRDMYRPGVLISLVALASTLVLGAWYWPFILN
ncbi:MAG: hypothetical protein A2527_07825 [Candidatus Lambdaproteobacteria bacterium RIFOXYD2_FULL_50_16]|uniref:Citrate transporter-like domain-containing protein n=1 Tax=Candidatus Lambdaproteobacteria bacterium RIFOXYD2_FULL_50_16 TaxID=1817772 RepID=A0A1F6GB08_9PROT|nr:MAG: hypothetical protein A2527_07825 [Candidatus Lambdaproteobacteria bacterium RIFOXYD2_FULL_50_16]